MTELYAVVGAFAGGFSAGLVAGLKMFRDLKGEVSHLRKTLEAVCDYLTDRFGMPQVAKPKNGKTADLGEAHPNGPTEAHNSVRMRKE